MKTESEHKCLTVASVVLNDFRHDNRVLKEARSLSNRGFGVTVVAMHADDLSEHESVENFHVHRIRVRSKSWSKATVVQALKYVEFLARALLAHRRADVYHCHDLLALPVGVFARLLLNRRARIVYDAHEHQAEQSGQSPARKALMRTAERALIRFADAVITVSEPIARDYSRIYGVPTPRLVLNAPPYTPPVRTRRLRDAFDIDEQRKIVLYQGAFHPDRGIELLLDTALNQAGENAPYVVVFMGYGSLEPRIRDAMNHSSNVFLHPAVGPDRLLEHTGSADFGVSLAEDNSLNNRYMMPNKMFEYIMAGVPIICSNLAELGRIVRDNEIGVVMESNTPEALHRAIMTGLALDADPMRKRLATLSQSFCWEEQERNLFEIYDELSNAINGTCAGN